MVKIKLIQSGIMIKCTQLITKREVISTVIWLHTLHYITLRFHTTI